LLRIPALILSLETPTCCKARPQRVAQRNNAHSTNAIDLQVVEVNQSVPPTALPAMFWLKAVALLKTPYISVTAATFHASGWLNTVAPEKRFVIQVTLAVFQLLMGWLKAVAELKVPCSTASRIQQAYMVQNATSSCGNTRCNVQHAPACWRHPRRSI
jgi:hypothetical protein